MTKIETNYSSVATGYAVSPAQAAAPRFSGAMREAQVLPRSAYVPSSEPYDRDKHGSHRVGGVELVPGAPGYDFDRALPRLKEIAANDRQLASYLTGKGIQVGPAMPETLPVEVEPVVIADPALQAALDEIESAIAPVAPSPETEATASTTASAADAVTSETTESTTASAADAVTSETTESTTASTADTVTTEPTGSTTASAADAVTTEATTPAAATAGTANPSETADSGETMVQNVEEASSPAASSVAVTAATELPNTDATIEVAANAIEPQTTSQTAFQTAPENLLVTSARYLSQHMELNLASSLMASAKEDVTQGA
jgi:hypothetical protein